MPDQNHVDPLAAILVGCRDFVDGGLVHGKFGLCPGMFPEPDRLKNAGFRR